MNGNKWMCVWQPNIVLFVNPIHWHQIRLQQITDTIQQTLNLYFEHQKIFSISNTSSYNTH